MKEQPGFAPKEQEAKALRHGRRSRKTKAVARRSRGTVMETFKSGISVKEASLTGKAHALENARALLSRFVSKRSAGRMRTQKARRAYPKTERHQPASPRNRATTSLRTRTIVSQKDAPVEGGGECLQAARKRSPRASTLLARLKSLRREETDDDLWSLLRSLNPNSADLADPEKWWIPANEVRRALSGDHPATAYAIAKAHGPLDDETRSVRPRSWRAGLRFVS